MHRASTTTSFKQRRRLSYHTHNMNYLFAITTVVVLLAPFVLGGGHGGGGYGGGGHGGGAGALGGDGHAFHGGYAYHGPLAQPVVLKSGYLADTKDVAAAKHFHLGALAHAHAHGGHGGGGGHY